MGDAMEATPSSPLDLNSIRSEVKELMEIHRSSKEDELETAPLDSEKLLKDCAQDFESKVKEIISECSDVSFLGIEDLDAYLENLKDELKTVEAERSKISNEIENLARTDLEDSSRLESDLEELNCALDLISSQGTENANKDRYVDCLTYAEDQSDLMKIHEDHKFEILELESQIEKNKIVLNSLQDLDSIFKRFDAIEQIEDSLTGLKVIDSDGNCFRLSLHTYIPKLEGSLFHHRIEDVIEPSEVNHELLIEVVDGTMELNNVEIFPNDVYISDIVDATKSFRQLVSQSALLETSSSLQWFIEKVQERIILSTLRRFLVKIANKSRHFFEYLDRDEMVVAHLVGGVDAFIKPSHGFYEQHWHLFEYLDRDEMVVAHLVGGVDAFIKPSHGWPLSNSPLNLISLKSPDNHSKEISLSILCKVEEAANSLDVHTRQNLSSFIDGVEKILLEQKPVGHQSDDNPAK